MPVVSPRIPYEISNGHRRLLSFLFLSFRPPIPSYASHSLGEPVGTVVLRLPYRR